MTDQQKRAAWTGAVWLLAAAVLLGLLTWWYTEWSLLAIQLVAVSIGLLIVASGLFLPSRILPDGAKQPLLDLVTQFLTWCDRQRNPVQVPFWTDSAARSIGLYLLCFGVSLSASIEIYQAAAVTSQNAIDEAYQRANVFEDALLTQSDVNWKQLKGDQNNARSDWPLDSQDFRERERLLFSLMKNLAIVEPDIFLNESGSTREERLKDLSEGKDAVHFLFDWIIPLEDQTDGSPIALAPDDDYLGVPWKVVTNDATKHRYPNSTASLVLAVSNKLGYRSKVHQAARSTNEPNALRARLLCAALSGKAGAARDLAELARAESATGTNNLATIHDTYDSWDRLPRGDANHWFFPDRGLSDSELLNAVFLFDRVMAKPAKRKEITDPTSFPANSFGPFFEPDKTSNYDALNRNDFLLIEAFSLELLSRLHSNPEVKTAKRWFAIVFGPEQFAMLFISLWMVCILFVRFAFRLYEWGQLERMLRCLQTGDAPRPVEGLAYRMWIAGSEAEVSDADRRIEFVADQASLGIPRSRWLISWIATALPAIGFIGTVRGMLLALGQADSIVRATTVAGRAAAITEVGSQLSLAFTTTLIALLLGLLTSFFSSLQRKSEQSLLARCESRIAATIHPELASAMTVRSDLLDNKGESSATPSPLE
ncbi:MotA/TolQ/ExbB proton channel family protein [Roseiconus lacunae]|uniref:MotA/TolQ/ExbB proton channel family protein n=1 Tax=Roseiconus lacunae TaxID=2605694 RepID=UPI00308DB0D9|nr:MotA/TolQ/ExbB proton channel family protein [Stieleria sp. HD01]